MKRLIWYVAPFLALAALGCGKPGSAPSKIDEPVAPNPEPKPQELPPAKAPPGVTWRENILSNAPGYLVPYRAADGIADPGKALEQVRTGLATDAATKALLKKLLRVETADIEVVDGPVPEKFAPSRKPGGEDDGLLVLYLQAAKQATIKGHVLLDFRYSIVAARSSTLTPHFSDANDMDAMRFAVNDFLLRKQLGYFFVRGRSDLWDETGTRSEYGLRKQLDADVERHVKKNAGLPLKMNK